MTPSQAPEHLEGKSGCGAAVLTGGGWPESPAAAVPEGDALDEHPIAAATIASKTRAGASMTAPASIVIFSKGAMALE